MRERSDQSLLSQIDQINRMIGWLRPIAADREHVRVGGDRQSVQLAKWTIELGRVDETHAFTRRNIPNSDRLIIADGIICRPSLQNTILLTAHGAHVG